MTSSGNYTALQCYQNSGIEFKRLSRVKYVRTLISLGKLKFNPMFSDRCLMEFKIRAVAGQRSSPDLCFATKFVKIYDP